MAETGGNRPARPEKTIIDQAAVISGWLLKRPGKAHFLGMKPWQKRFVVLDCIANTLSYYKSEDCVKASGMIELQKVENVDRGANKTDFNVQTSVEQRVYWFRCNTEEDCNKWFEPLKVYGKAFRRGNEGPQQQCIKMRVLMSLSVKLPKSQSMCLPVAFLESASGTKDNPVWSELCRTETPESDSKLDKTAKRRFFVLLAATLPCEELKADGTVVTYTGVGPDLRVVVYDSKRLAKDKMDRHYMETGRPQADPLAHLMTVTFTLNQLLTQPDCTLYWGFADNDDARKRGYEDSLRMGKSERHLDGLLDIKFEGTQECVEFSGGRVNEQSYKLPRKGGGWLLLHERLAESPFTFNVPFQLFHRAYLNECMWLKKLKSALVSKEKRIKGMKPPDDFHRVANLLADAFGMDDGKAAPSPHTKLDEEIFILKEEIRLSRESRGNLRTQRKIFQDYSEKPYLGLRFKPSVKKNDLVLAWIATNLHKQTFTIQLYDAEQSHHGSPEGAGARIILAPNLQRHEQDTITVGAFAAHPLKFKHGGMSGCCAELVDLRAQTVMYRQAGTPVRQKLQIKLRTREFDLDQRKAMVWSQGLSALTSAFVAHLMRQLQEIILGNQRGAQVLLRQQELGFLVQVESLLSTFAHERGMLEDHQYAVGRMRNTRFRCRRVVKASDEALVRAEIVGIVLPRPDDLTPDGHGTSSTLPGEMNTEGARHRGHNHDPSFDDRVFARPRSGWLPTVQIPDSQMADWMDRPSNYSGSESSQGVERDRDSVMSESPGTPHGNAGTPTSFGTPTGLGMPPFPRARSVATIGVVENVTIRAGGGGAVGGEGAKGGGSGGVTTTITTATGTTTITSVTGSLSSNGSVDSESEQTTGKQASVDAFKASAEEKALKMTRGSTIQHSASTIQPSTIQHRVAPLPPRKVAKERSPLLLPAPAPSAVMYAELDSAYGRKEEAEDSEEKDEPPTTAEKKKDDDPDKKRNRVRWVSFSGVQVRSLAGHRILDKAGYSEKTSLTNPLNPPSAAATTLGTPASIHVPGTGTTVVSFTPPTSASFMAPPGNPSPPLPPSPSRLPSSASALPMPLRREKSTPPDPMTAPRTELEFRPGQGDRGDLDEGCLVELLLPSYLYDVLPAELRQTDELEPQDISLEFETYPVLITQGVNEQQSVADTINKGLREQQTTINRVAAKSLANYASDYLKYQQKEGPSVTQLSDSKLKQMIRAMEQQAWVDNNSKNLELLYEVAKAVRHMGGSRIICCKSAKDRTSMSVTLDQYRLVKKAMEEDFPVKVNDVDEGDLLRWLQVSRLEGVRISNTTKNTGQRGFAFNALQRSCLPELLRPPENACGKSQPT